MKSTPIKSLPEAIQADIQKRKTNHEKLLKNLSFYCKDETEGFFGPESITWKMYREPYILLGSSRALLLQIAHPAIADGVKNYSNFQKKMAGRAHRTFTSMIRIWFGDKNTAINSAKRLYNIHSMIRGTAVWEIEDETIYKPYCAADPDLLFWVLATMIDTTLVVIEKINGTIPSEEKNQFFEESKITAQLMGIPLEDYPKNLESFYQHYYSIIDDKTLCVGKAGIEISKAIFNLPYPIRKFLQLIAGGFLPLKISHQFGLSMNKFSTLIFNLVVFISKLNYKLMPAFLRYAPAFHQANYRIAKAKGRKTKFLEKMHHWLGENINLYFISNKLNAKI
jgi:uncharacterized protein (DUF2236 family)